MSNNLLIALFFALANSDIIPIEGYHLALKGPE